MPSIKPFSKAALNEVIRELGENRVKINEPLKNHTWMKVGGPADVFFIARTQEDLKTAYSLARRRDIPVWVLGGGSNVVVRDGGIRGLVIKNMANKISLASVKGSTDKKKIGISQVGISASSGVTINQLVRHTMDEGLVGLEEFLGVPGTVGGAVYNNAHHLSHLIGDYISTVEVIDELGNTKNYTREQMKFAYDYSILHKTHELVISATFALTPGDKVNLWEKAENALKRRRMTQPLEKPSSGCMFKNIKTSEALIHVTPNHTVSAGMLIDKAGLKGMKVGGAEVSEVHANFIVNLGNATADDIQKLSDIVKDRVQEKFGVTLDREVFFIGEA